MIKNEEGDLMSDNTTKNGEQYVYVPKGKDLYAIVQIGPHDGQRTCMLVTDDEEEAIFIVAMKLDDPYFDFYRVEKVPSTL